MLIVSRLDERLFRSRHRWNERLLAAQADLGRHFDLYLAAFIIAAISVQTALFFDWNNFYEENAPAEMAQNVFLLLASLFFLAAAIADLNRVARLSLGGLALFCFTAFIREVDIKGTALGDCLGRFTELELHFVAAGLAALALITASRRHFAVSVRGMMRWACASAGRWFLVGAAFYLLGDAAEKNFFSSGEGKSEMIEETLEQAATMFFALAASLTFASPAARALLNGRQTP